MERVCVKCKLNSAYLNRICKECKKEYDHEYHIKNQEKRNRYHKKYYLKNKEERKEYAKKNKNSIAVFQKEWREKNKPYIAQKNKEYQINNKVVISEYKREYFLKNKDYILKYQREYQKKWRLYNKEKIYQYYKKYITEKLSKNPQFKINFSISRSISKSLKGNKSGRHWEDLVGYNLKDLIKHLKKNFQPGMTLENYGEWHLDHRVPKSVFNFSKPEHIDFLKCWSLDNLQPLWAKDNLSKNAKIEKPFQPSLAF